MSTTNRKFVCVVNSKGGIGKSLLTMMLLEEIAATAGPWTVVEIEHRAKMTQHLYRHPAGTKVAPIALFAKDERSNLTDAGIGPLDTLWDLLPKPDQPEGESRILIDFGASSFQSFMLWGLERRGLQPFRKAGYQFVFFVPVQAADLESASFFNENAPSLRRLGKVILVKNLREGSNFSLLSPEITADTPTMTMLYTGLPVSEELQQTDHRLTFRQLANLPTASYRAQIDAEICADHFSKQMKELSPAIGL